MEKLVRYLIQKMTALLRTVSQVTCKPPCRKSGQRITGFHLPYTQPSWFFPQPTHCCLKRQSRRSLSSLTSGLTIYRHGDTRHREEACESAIPTRIETRNSTSVEAKHACLKKRRKKEERRESQEEWCQKEERRRAPQSYSIHATTGERDPKLPTPDTRTSMLTYRSTRVQVRCVCMKETG